MFRFSLLIVCAGLICSAEPIVVEAEDFARQTRDEVRGWQPMSKRPNTSGNYIEILPDTRRTHVDKLIHGENFSNEPGVMGILHYPIMILEAGRYYVWVRAFSEGTGDNGIHVGLNGRVARKRSPPAVV